MKLIIDIPDHEYKYTCEQTLSDRTFWDNAIRKGTPLDDVKAEIEEKSFELFEYDVITTEEIFEIIDNIGKAESEE